MMGVGYNPKIVTDGLVLCLDAANVKSYPNIENFLLYSEDYSNAAWDKTSYPVTVASSAETPPVSGMAVYSLTTTNAPSLIIQYINTSVTGQGQLVASIYAKAGTSTQFTLNPYYNGETEVNTTFNLTGSGSVVSGTGTIISVGNGWYLCSCIIPATTTTRSLFLYRIWPEARGTFTTKTLYVAGSRLAKGTVYYPYTKTTSATITATTWTDLSGRGNHGTLTNGPTFSNINNGQLSFSSASSQYVSVNDSSTLTSETMSVEAWVTFSVAGTRIIYCGKGAGSSFADTEYWLERTAGNKFSVWFSNGTTGSNHLLASSSVSINTWYHVVGVYDGAAIRGYVNGIQDPATFSLTGSIVNTSVAYSVGRLGSLASLYHNGSIAVNRIYNRALTAAEIQQNFNALRGRFGI